LALTEASIHVSAFFCLGPADTITEEDRKDVLRLKKLETFHFMMAGPEGAIVDEWACYHDNDGPSLFYHPGFMFSREFGLYMRMFGDHLSRKQVDRSLK